MQLLFESEDLRVLHHRGETDTGWITFASNLRDGPFADRYVAGRRDSGVFLLPLTDHWYQTPDIWEALRRAHAVLPKSRRIAYGSSRGGFAALAYVKDLEVDLVIAVSPQISHDPDLVSAFDQRWPELARLDFQRRDARPGAAETDVIILYDPLVEEDREHVKRLPGRKLRFPLAGHAALYALNDCLVLKPLLDGLLAGDPECVRVAQREFKRVRGLSAYGHLAAGRALRARGRLDEALSHYAQCLVINAGHSEAHHEMALCLAALDRWEEACASMSRAIHIHPHPDLYGLREAMLRHLGRGQSVTSPQSIDSPVTVAPDTMVQSHPV